MSRIACRWPPTVLYRPMAMARSRVLNEPAPLSNPLHNQIYRLRVLVSDCIGAGQKLRALRQAAPVAMVDGEERVSCLHLVVDLGVNFETDGEVDLVARLEPARAQRVRRDADGA